VVVDPEDYPVLIEHLEGKGIIEEETLRKHLAWKAFQHTASYDSAVAEWLWKQRDSG
jgi:phosphoribosylaminoimidazolecarboxamide formyltransferase/IMP cyclohydrolase